MFRGPPGRRGPRARALCLKRMAPVCKAQRGSGSSNNSNNRVRSNASASSSSGANFPLNLGGGAAGGAGSTTLILQGALGVGIGVGLGLGFGMGVSNMLQLGDFEGALSGDFDPLQEGEKELTRLKLKQKGNALQNALSGLVKKLKSHARNRKVTDVLIQLNCLTFFLQKASKGWLSAWGCKHNQAIASGQLWRLFTPALLHGNLLHLLVNCYTLNHLGPTTEALFGGKRMLAVYVLSGVSGNVFSFYMNHLPAVGCSGALFGLLGALGYFYYKHSNVLKKEHVERPLRSLNHMVLTNLVIGLTTPNIDNWAHMGGLFAGVAAVMLLGPSFSVEQDNGPKLVDKPLLPVLASKPLSLK
ncbi:rhomboid-like peptidase [Chloropicon primus]|uniref:Rhomboid-like peptidase n=1 Tax=Chloropicon primus TaxID=1764295 RepID=A0A5B8MLS6_9CHLO|nr:rhomboid-like peptidase [Chloropicon primus]UPR00655.1 rhomboid-like peptidase [Chloropicon primus]|mmetsp:Transcript_9392/g.26723  ORF Transcript_9392/g.26723 Transcript_9392/m.26723 type:complete len:358 (-) Transcript_9392:1171-2244(-)|eukprot:QDZ21443.1 rhomboid-like peptidase [Chloropicon primus]